MRNNAEKLIAVAGQSREMEAWISRQLMAGQKPSQILAELGQGVVDRACAALANASIRLAIASSFMFALAFLGLAIGVP
jgi:hypothetical protein